MAGVQIQGVTKVYKPGTPPASDNIDLEIKDGEFFILLGPSGCGKSTLLRMIAGLERVTEGAIRIGEKLVDGGGGDYIEPKNRDIAMVFQSYALYPHMTVFDNMAFGLKLRGVKRELIKTRIEEAAESLGLSPYLQRLPKELSGGQRQRVALGRALVREPKVFLLDEPLSNLDAKLRGGMRVELKRLQTSLATTMIYVTHDQVEAMTLGDRIAVFKSGQLQQVGAPLEIYRRPANRFVAGFLGSPPMNFIPGRLVSGGTIKINSEQSFFVPEAMAKRLPAEADVELGVRPEDLLVKKPNHGALKATVEVLEALGDRTDAHVRLVGGDAATLADPDAPHIIARVEAGDRIPARGELVGLVPRNDRLLVFDRETGRVLAAAEEEE